ncbi:MAG: hypothetical protein PHV83_06355, partial [Bacteroidales bacterium]|nr:hypothetical protein [Bacteroidales bacterium]
GQGGGEKIAKEFYTTLLTQLPLIQDSSENAKDIQNLYIDDENPMKNLFDNLADKVIEKTKK